MNDPTARVPWFGSLFPNAQKQGVFARAYRDVFTAVPKKTPEPGHIEAVFDVEIGSSK